MANWTLCTLALACAFLAVAKGLAPCSNDIHGCPSSLPDTECDLGGECSCSNGYKGPSHLKCFPDTYQVCSLLNDPSSTPYAGPPSVNVHLPCRFLATDITVNVPNSDGLWCRSRVYAYGWRNRGKIYLSGFDVRLDWESNSISRYTLSIKAYGKIVGGAFQIDRLTRHSRFGGGDQWQRDEISLDEMDSQLGGTNVFEVDQDNQRILMSSSVCGIDVAFRLYDLSAGSAQPQVSGLALAYNPAAGSITFNDVIGSACNTPSLDHPGAKDLVDPILPTEEGTLYRLAAHDRGQAFPSGDTAKCTALQQETAACTNSANRDNALRRCSFILSAPKFLHCYSVQSNSGDAISLYIQCLDAFCAADSTKCGNFKSAIAATACKSKDADAMYIDNNSCATLL